MTTTAVSYAEAIKIVKNTPPAQLAAKVRYFILFVSDGESSFENICRWLKLPQHGHLYEGGNAARNKVRRALDALVKTPDFESFRTGYRKFTVYKYVSAEEHQRRAEEKGKRAVAEHTTQQMLAMLERYGVKASADRYNRTMVSISGEELEKLCRICRRQGFGMT